MSDEEVITYTEMINNTVILPIEVNDYYGESVVATFSAKEIKNSILIFKESDFYTFIYKMGQQDFMSKHEGKLIARAYMSNCYQVEIGENGKLNIPDQIFEYIKTIIEGTVKICRETALGVECLAVKKDGI